MKSSGTLTAVLGAFGLYSGIAIGLSNPILAVLVASLSPAVMGRFFVQAKRLKDRLSTEIAKVEQLSDADLTSYVIPEELMSA